MSYHHKCWHVLFTCQVVIFSSTSSFPLCISVLCRCEGLLQPCRSCTVDLLQCHSIQTLKHDATHSALWYLYTSYSTFSCLFISVCVCVWVHVRVYKPMHRYVSTTLHIHILCERGSKTDERDANGFSVAHLSPCAWIKEILFVFDASEFFN